MNQPPKKHITNSGEVKYFLQKELHIDKQIVDSNIIISQYLKKTSILPAALLNGRNGQSRETHTTDITLCM